MDKKRHWDTSNLSQVSNCDGSMLDVYLDHKFQEKPFCGFWDLWSKSISSATPL